MGSLFPGEHKVSASFRSFVGYVVKNEQNLARGLFMIKYYPQQLVHPHPYLEISLLESHILLYWNQILERPAKVKLNDSLDHYAS